MNLIYINRFVCLGYNSLSGHCQQQVSSRSTAIFLPCMWSIWVFLWKSPWKILHITKRHSSRSKAHLTVSTEFCQKSWSQSQRFNRLHISDYLLSTFSKNQSLFIKHPLFVTEHWLYSSSWQVILSIHGNPTRCLVHVKTCRWWSSGWLSGS